MTASYLVIGMSHRTAGGGLRDRLSSEEAEVPMLLEGLRGAGLEQALWLSTCDRVEVLAVHRHPAPHQAEAALAVAGMMAARLGTEVAALDQELYTLTGPAAVRHVFAVAASLDSQIIGEPAVLGQLKAAHRLSVAADMSGPELEALMQAAYAVAKRVRSETAIAEGATSLVAAALQVGRDLFGELTGSSALLLGLGDMGLMVLEGLREAGLARFTIAAPIDRRAEAAARRLGGHFAPWAELDAAVAPADIVVSAVGLGRAILSAETMAAALRRRRQRPVFVIDAAIPTDVEPDVGRLEGAFVYDLADLERVALAGRAGRQAAQEAAFALVEDAVRAFVRDRAERAAVPAVAALRRRFERERRRLLAEHGGLDAGAATRLLINRLLHEPSTALREMAAESGAHALTEHAQAERLLARLFDLDQDGPRTSGPRNEEEKT